MIPEFNLKYASVEVTTACNHRCKYCPVSNNPQKQKIMDLDTFRLTLEQTSQLGSSFRRISFNHYNEPLLDPLLAERVKMAYDYSFFDFILLSSNLGINDRNLIPNLEPFKDRVRFNINLPSASRERYAKLHGIDQYLLVEKNIEELVDAGFHIGINVQTNHFTTPDDAKSVQTRFGESLPVKILNSNSRAGLVDGFNASVDNRNRSLVGCAIDRPIKFLHFGVEGEVFFCCQDYYKRYVVGNIAETPLSDIIQGSLMSNYLKIIYNKEPTSADFICLKCEDAVYE